MEYSSLIHQRIHSLHEVKCDMIFLVDRNTLLRFFEMRTAELCHAAPHNRRFCLFF